jgi:hypothetical protein
MDAYMALQRYLRPGEDLLWAGRPDPRVWFAPADAFLVPFSILWCAFAIFWECGVVAGGAPGFFAVWGIPFVAAGLYMVAGRFAYKRYGKGRTVYGVTGQRALIVAPRGFADLPLHYQPVTVRRTRDGRHASVDFGSTAFPGRTSAFRSRRGPTWYYANTGLEPWARGTGLQFAFYDVADPDAMLAALDQARTQPAS